MGHLCILLENTLQKLHSKHHKLCGVYIGKGTILVQSRNKVYFMGKIHNLWSASDHYFPVLNRNNSLCISSI